MNNSTIEESVARLDGFLSAGAIYTGRFRDYNANAYLLKQESVDSSVENMLINFYKEQSKLVISTTETIKDGHRGLDPALGPYLVQRSNGVEDLLVLQKYAVFKVSDLITSVFEDIRIAAIFKLCGFFENTGSKCVFFTINAFDSVLVLQFNDNTPVER